MRVPAATFAAEWNDVEKLKSAGGQDRYGRNFGAEQACKPPFHAVKVTGALFHTQGGLAINSKGRVKRKDGKELYQPVCGGRRGRRRVRLDRGGLSVRQRSFDGHRSRPLDGREPRRSKYSVDAAAGCLRAARYRSPKAPVAQLDRAPDLEIWGSGFLIPSGAPST